MITGWDDYFVHQTSNPIVQTTPVVPNFMDRMYFNSHDRNGRFMLGVGLGQYRNTSRMDAIAYLCTPGEQQIIRLARVTGHDDYAEPRIGPLRFDIEEPLKRWRAVLSDNASDITWDLVFEAPRPPFGFTPFDFGEAQDRSQYRHFVQLGRTRGSVSFGGKIVQVSDGLALRDRSWGVRRSRERQGLHLWLQHALGDTDLFLIYNEARDGSVAYCDGAIVDDEGQHHIISVGHDLHFVATARDVDAAQVSVVDDRGLRHDLDYQRLLSGYVGGVGYGGWAGAEHPDGLFELERIDTTAPAGDLLADQPILLFDHLCRIAYRDVRTVGSLQLGITRSSSYQYAPRSVQ